MYNSLKKSFYIDKILLIILLLITSISLVAIYAAEPIMQTYLQGSNLWLKQLFWFVLGAFTIISLLFFGIDRIFTGVKIIYWILMLCLLILLIDKFIFDIPDSIIRPISGTTAWFQIKYIGTFQPSEFMKIALIIINAEIIHEHNINKSDNSFQSDLQLFLKIGKYTIPPLLMILVQPDTGIPIVIIISTLIMLLISGIRKEWFFIGLTTILIIIIIFFTLYYFFPNQLLEISQGGYRLKRFYGWLEHEKYYLSYGNQLYTSLLALGSAGLNGHDFAQLIVYFPEAQTDFIFAVIGQNFGFIGTTTVVILCLALDIKILSIAKKYPPSPEKYLVYGVVGMLAFQQIQNMSMICGLLPITGITLPFISYGGSSILSYMIPLAIIFYMSSENTLTRIH